MWNSASLPLAQPASIPTADNKPFSAEETELPDVEEDDEAGVEAWEDRELKGEGIKPRFA